MKKFFSALMLVLVTCLAQAELPKSVQLDIHVRAAASYFKKQQYQQCLGELDKVERLSAGRLASDLVFIRAKSHFQLQQLGSAKRQATIYIEREGKKGRYYEQALELMVAVEQQSGEQIGVLKRRGRDFLKKENFRESFKAYQEAADLGDAFSQGQMGWFLRFGKEGVAKDVPQAVNWFEKAAENGNRWSAERLGWIYRNGEEPVAQDKAKALTWFKRAADMGSHEAMRLLGSMLLSGEGVPADAKQALAWLHKAADDGDEASMKRLAKIYEEGAQGVGSDPAQAVKWLKRAAGKGDTSAMQAVGRRYFSGDGVEKDAARGVSWYKKAADKGDEGAMMALGHRYSRGKDVEKDQSQAYAWYEKAYKHSGGKRSYAKYRMNQAYMDWAQTYLKGEGVPKDENKGISMYVRLAAKMKNGQPYYHLAKYYERSEQKQAAMQWYQKSADLVFLPAIRVLANCYAGKHDCGVAADRERAVQEYSRLTAAEGNAYFNRAGHLGLACLYFRSDRPEQDWPKAVQSLANAKVPQTSYRSDAPVDYVQALIKATSPVDGQRDAQAAMALLSPYLDSTWQMHMVRAAVHAELGQFELAQAAQQMAMTLAQGEDMDKDWVWGGWGRELEAQLESYQKQKPWRYPVQRTSAAPTMPNF